MASFDPQSDPALSSYSTDSSSDSGEAIWAWPVQEPSRFSLSEFFSWCAIGLAALVLIGGNFYTQFFESPQPVEKLPSQAEITIRMALGVDSVDQDGASEAIAPLLESGPVIQRLGGILAQSEIAGPEVAAESLQVMKEQIEEYEYEPTDLEIQLISGVTHLIDVDRLKLAKKETRSGKNEPQDGEIEEVADANGTDANAKDKDSNANDKGSGAGADGDLKQVLDVHPVVVDPVPVEESVLEEERALIKKHMGIAGALVLGNAKDVKARAMVSVVGATLVMAIVALASCVGLALLVTLIYYAGLGQLSGLMQVPGTGTPYYLEAFAVWIVGFVMAQFGVGVVVSLFGMDLKNSPVLASVVSLAIFYGPMFVGLFWLVTRHPAPRTALRQVGFRSDGFLMDFGHAIVTYLAFLPLIGLSMLLTVGLTALVLGDESAANPFSPSRGPSHPISEQFGGSPWMLAYLYLMAAISAPIVEEIVFRGLLFRWLRDRTWQWGQSPEKPHKGVAISWPSVAISALVNSLLFAAIHPQGLLGIPPLMMIGICMSVARNWRGGLVAPMTIHAIHNGTLVTLMAILSY